MNKEEIKNTFYDLIYLKHITDPKIQKLLNQDKDEINSHLYNAGSLINENKILNDDNKEKINNYINYHLKKN